MRRRSRLERGFPPLVAAGARVLVLGSLPGRASLAARQYYAQPQNAFWRIMGALVAAGPELPYAERVARLTAAGIAVWDVLAAGERPGSLDSAIVRSSAVVNDFAGLLAAQASISLVCFNGRAALELYERRVLPTLGARQAAIVRRLLPSTSPAHAGMRFGAKLECWSLVREHLEPGRPAAGTEFRPAVARASGGCDATRKSPRKRSVPGGA